jgi:hypothetical protein
MARSTGLAGRSGLPALRSGQELRGKAHRPGVYQCNEPACRQQFTVTVGTIFERSKIPLSKWLAALFLITASKDLVSAHQVHCMLNISYKSTWFMMHRLHKAALSIGLTRANHDALGRLWRLKRGTSVIYFATQGRRRDVQ